MSVPYYMRIFRRAQTPDERRDIFHRAPYKMKQYMRRNSHLCLKCFNAPALEGLVGGDAYGNHCLKCYREQNKLIQRRLRFVRGVARHQLTPHQRVCVDCGQLFESKRGNNLCRPCTQSAREIIARRCLERSPDQVPSVMLVSDLYRRFGHHYKSSKTPRIPLSTIGVFEAVSR